MSPTQVLLVDANGYALLNPESGQFDYVRSEKSDLSALTASRQLLLYSRSKKQVLVIEPLSDTLVKDTAVVHADGEKVALSTLGVYLSKGANIHLERKDNGDDNSLAMEVTQIVKLESVNGDKPHIHVWGVKDQKLCKYIVTLDLKSSQLENCFSESAVDGSWESLADVFLDNSGSLVQVGTQNYKIGQKEFSLESVAGTTTQCNLRCKLTQKQSSSCISQPYSALSDVCIKDGKITFRQSGVRESVTVNAKLDTSDLPIAYFESADNRSLLIVTKLSELLFIDLTARKLVFQKDESLAEISEVAFVHKRFTHDEYEFIRTYEQYLNNKSIVGAWKTRMAYSIHQLNDFVRGTVGALSGFVSGISQGNVKSAFGSVVDLGLEGQSGQKNNHAPKVALLFTKSGKIWSYDLDELKLGSYTLISAEFKATHEGSIDFTKPEENPGCWISKYSKFELLLDCSGASNIKKRFTIDSDLKTQELFADTQKVAANQRFKLEKDKNQLTGSQHDRQTWRLQIPADQTILRIDRIQDFKIPHSSFQIENANVLYKLVDPNNALVTAKAGDILHVYVVNLKFGKILATFKTGKAALEYGIQTLVDDNSFMIAYFNSETLTQELLNVELFRKRIENDFVRIIKAQFGDKERCLPDINYSAADPEYVVLHRRFGLPIHVRKIKAFDSNVDLTAKNIIIVNDQDQIYSLPRLAVSTRRATEQERTKAEEQLARPNKAKIDPLHYFRSLTLEPYKYYLQLVPGNFITKDIRVAGLKDVWMEPTSFESTSFLIGTGKEMLVTVHSPNGAFDQLPEDFNKPMLWLFLVAFIVLITVTGKIAARKAPVNRFLQFIGS